MTASLKPTDALHFSEVTGQFLQPALPSWHLLSPHPPHSLCSGQNQRHLHKPTRAPSLLQAPSWDLCLPCKFPRCLLRWFLCQSKPWVSALTGLLLLLLSRFSCVRLCATPQTAAHQALPSLGFSRKECWSGVPLPSLGISKASPLCVPQDSAATPPTERLDSSSAFRTCLYFACSLLYPYLPTLRTVFKDCQFRLSVGQNSLHFL